MLTNVLLLVFEMWLLSLIILWLHWISPKYGLSPLLVFMGAVIAVLRFASPIGVYVRFSDAFAFTFASNVFIPIILFAVLIIYVANGTIPTRIIITTMVGIELLTVGLVMMLRNHLSMEGGGSFSGVDKDFLIFESNHRTTFASITAFAIDLISIAIIYQALHNYLPKLRPWLASGITLWATLSINSVVFWGIASANWQEFRDFLPGALLGSFYSALALWLLLGFYLERIIAKHPAFNNVENRPTFDLLFGSFSRLEIELARSTAALEAIKNQYESLTDNSNDVFWISDPDHNIYYLSPSFEKVWGYSRQEVYADPLTFFRAVYHEDQERLFLAQSQQDLGTYDEQFRVVRPDGEIRWLRGRAFPIIEDQNVKRVVGVATDITTTRQLQDQNFQLNEAREKVKVLRQFISEATHDIKNPLTAINLKIAMLESSSNPDKRQQYLNELQDQTMRLAGLVDDILTVTKIEQGERQTLVPTSLKHVLNNALANLKAVARNKGVHLEKNLPNGNFMVLGNEHELMRVFNNLIDNAIRYNKPDGTVHVALHEVEGKYVITVRDTGMGIDEESLAHIYEQFYRSPSAKMQEPSGSGLGLAIVKRLVERHNGTIHVESQLEQGTTFTISFPPLRH